MKSELDKIEKIQLDMEKEFKIDISREIPFKIDFERIDTHINTFKINEQINAGVQTSTTLDRTKINEGWIDSGITITFSEALNLLG